MSVCYKQNSVISKSKTDKRRLKLLSYNIQVGIGCHNYQDYLIQSWRHLMPDSTRQTHLKEIARYLSDYDVVALQEVDSGSVRTDYLDQVAFLAQSGGFPHWYHQKNRKLGKLAAHSNGILTKHPANQIFRHKLPGTMSCRGALHISFGSGEYQLQVLSVHLSLRTNTRKRQLNYISQLVKNAPYFIIMGDMNCAPSQVETEFKKNGLSMQLNSQSEATFPRWSPKYHFDQIWLSQGLNLIKTEVLKFGVSDHLPISVEIEIPEKMCAFNELSVQYLKSYNF